jgi:D-inositol-3-phosphate glycosyltransferase
MSQRIAMISEHASPLADLGSTDSGGQNVYVAQVSLHLARLGYEVDIFTRRDNQELPEIFEWKDGVRVIHVPAGPAKFVPKESLLPHMKSFRAYMINFIRQQEQPYDLIHANFWMSGLVAVEIKRALGIPFVITFHALGKVRRVHQGQNDGFPDERFEIEERIVNEADQIIAECPQDEQDLINLYDADPGVITVIPCGFDPQELWPQGKSFSRKLLGLPASEYILLQLGRMVPRKGVETAVRGLAALKKRHRVPARLIIVGGESKEPDPLLTPEIGRLRSIAEEEGISDLVTFTGRRKREEILNYYAAADVFISTPWYEPFGITPVEAMACGTPVIGSKVGGIKYTVVHGETGFLIPPNDVDALARRLAYLYRHPEKLERFSRYAIERANQLFTWEKVSERLAETYEEAIAYQTATNEESEQLAVIDKGIEAAIQTFIESRQILKNDIIQAARTILDCILQGNKVMVIGNGGSAADAQHFAAEFSGRFIHPDRNGLPVMALTADTAFLTAWANDVGYEKVFSRQVETFGQPGDLLIGISTSGRSQNVIEAFKTAKRMGIGCIAFLGGDGGELLPLSDQALVAPATNTQRIQEAHILLLHLISELVEEKIVSMELSSGVFPARRKRKQSSVQFSNGGDRFPVKDSAVRSPAPLVAGPAKEQKTWKFNSSSANGGDNKKSRSNRKA